MTCPRTTKYAIFVEQSAFHFSWYCYPHVFKNPVTLNKIKIIEILNEILKNTNTKLSN